MLDDRLRAVAAFVPDSCSVADIGTDHAYLAIELKKQNPDRNVIAADKNAGPCQAAAKTIAEAGWQDEIQVRQGDGLKAVAPGEIDTACIAGMGGKLIADILAAAPDVFAQLSTLVLQPQNGYEYLRQWLYNHDWHIQDEILAKVDGRLYQIIQAVPGRIPMPSQQELLLGPVLCQVKPPLWEEHVDANINTLDKIRQGLLRSTVRDEARLEQIEIQIKALEVLKS